MISYPDYKDYRDCDVEKAKDGIETWNYLKPAFLERLDGGKRAGAMPVSGHRAVLAR
jgi:hypothetical protein